MPLEYRKRHTKFRHNNCPLLGPSSVMYYFNLRYLFSGIEKFEQSRHPYSPSKLKLESHSVTSWRRLPLILVLLKRFFFRTGTFHYIKSWQEERSFRTGLWTCCPEQYFYFNLHCTKLYYYVKRNCTSCTNGTMNL